ncbi:hypothetical protein, partial [Candidatus Avelusimicrobium alvi]
IYQKKKTNQGGEPPLPFPNGTIRLIKPHCLNNVAKHRNSEPEKPPAEFGPYKTHSRRMFLQLASLKQVKTFFRLEAFYKQG